MNDPAAFQATFIDQRPVKSRKMHQFIFEVPAEAANHALAVLGGLPNPGESVWVGIARLHPPAKEETSDLEQPPVPAADPNHSPGRPKMKWDEMTCAQQAGVLCSDERFWEYTGSKNAETAAEWVRAVCGVRSRGEIDGTGSERIWRDIVRAYRAEQAGRPF